MEKMNGEGNCMQLDYAERIEKLIEEISMLRVERQNLKKEYKEKNKIYEIWYEEKGKKKAKIYNKVKKYNKAFYSLKGYISLSVIISILCSIFIAFPINCIVAPCLYLIIMMKFPIVLNIYKNSKDKKIDDFDVTALKELIELEEMLSHTKKKLNQKKKQLQTILDKLNRNFLIDQLYQNQILEQQVQYQHDIYDAYPCIDRNIQNQTVEMDIEKKPYTNHLTHE